MSKIKVQTTVTGPLFNVQVFLEGNEISLNHDGSETWHSINMVEVKNETLEVLIHAQGISKTKWAFEINELEPAAKELRKDSLVIKPNGHSLALFAVKI
jgi:hypothetical protein